MPTPTTRTTPGPFPPLSARPAARPPQNQVGPRSGGVVSGSGSGKAWRSGSGWARCSGGMSGPGRSPALVRWTPRSPAGSSPPSTGARSGCTRSWTATGICCWPGRCAADPATATHPGPTHPGTVHRVPGRRVGSAVGWWRSTSPSPSCTGWSPTPPRSPVWSVGGPGCWPRSPTGGPSGTGCVRSWRVIRGPGSPEVRWPAMYRSGTGPASGRVASGRRGARIWTTPATTAAAGTPSRRTLVPGCWRHHPDKTARLDAPPARARVVRVDLPAGSHVHDSRGADPPGSARAGAAAGGGRPARRPRDRPRHPP